MAMASSSSLYLYSLLLLAIFAIGANARPGAHFHPCNTLFVSSSFTKISFYPRNPIHNNYRRFPLNPNPNQNENKPQQRLFAIVDFLSQQRQQQPSDSRLVFATATYPRGPFIGSEKFLFPQSVPLRRLGKSHTVTSGVTSLRERTKDILSVVAALLFGVGCGAFTSAFLYLAWSVITDRREEENETVFAEGEEEASLKKLGYSKIPDQVPAVTVVAPAKEVV